MGQRGPGLHTIPIRIGRLSSCKTGKLNCSSYLSRRGKRDAELGKVKLQKKPAQSWSSSSVGLR